MALPLMLVIPCFGRVRLVGRNGCAFYFTCLLLFGGGRGGERPLGIPERKGMDWGLTLFYGKGHVPQPWQVLTLWPHVCDTFRYLSEWGITRKKLMTDLPASQQWHSMDSAAPNLN